MSATLLIAELKQRWQAMPVRDRQALVGLSLFLGLVLLYVFCWLPAQRQLDTAQRYFSQQRELLAYLQQQAPQIQAGAAGQPAQVTDPQQLQGMVGLSAGEHGLQVERLDSEGEGVVQVSLQPVPFTQLLEWIKQLRDQGVQVAEAALERKGDGLIAARLLLRSGN